MTTEQRTLSRRSVNSRIHEHGWVTESAHRTSEGTVIYVLCAGCGTRRVDVATVTTAVPTPITVSVRE